MNTATLEKRSKLATVKVGREFNMQAFHTEMQQLRRDGEDVTFKSFLAETFGPEYTPEKFYAEAGIDISTMTVQKMLNTSDLNRYLFPEIFRDAIRIGLEYTPFYKQLIVGEETIAGTGITMPSMDIRSTPADNFRLRDVNEGGTIPEGEVVTWQDKQVTVHKKARGLRQTYESLMFTPINLATVYFEEVGVRLGADLDRDLINIAINGDQADLSQSAPVIGATTANALVYADLARAWIRFRRIGRNSTVMLCNEDDALAIFGMAEFQRTRIPDGVTPSGITVRLTTPLPTSQDILVHDSVPAKKIIFIDTARAFVQLTAMPLLVETEKIVSRQITGEFVSMITGFANIFRDGRMVLDWSTNTSTNPGPTLYS